MLIQQEGSSHMLSKGNYNIQRPRLPRLPRPEQGSGHTTPPLNNLSYTILANKNTTNK